MKFVLQKENTVPCDLDVLLVEEVLRTSRFQTYACVPLCMVSDPQYADAVPVGSLPYVQAWLSANYRIPYIPPIEVPECLRSERFLKRDYRIVSEAEVPAKGFYFLKDVSRLKKFSLSGYLENVKRSALLVPDHFYQLSEVVDILAEYRVYVLDGTICRIAFYDGDPLVFPDVPLLTEAVLRYNNADNCPHSYTIDVMVIRGRGTAIIEIHPFISVGLYSTVWDSDLLYAYKDGIDWAIRQKGLLAEAGAGV